jgi:hypothetical protein
MDAAGTEEHNGRTKIHEQEKIRAALRTNQRGRKSTVLAGPATGHEGSSKTQIETGQICRQNKIRHRTQQEKRAREYLRPEVSTQPENRILSRKQVRSVTRIEIGGRVHCS